MFGFRKEFFRWKKREPVYCSNDGLSIESSIKIIELYNEILNTALKMIGDERIPEDVRVEYGALIQDVYGELFDINYSDKGE